LQFPKNRKKTNFFLSISGTSLFSALSTITYIETGIQVNQQKEDDKDVYRQKKLCLTGILSGYFSLMRAASACLLSGMKV